MKWVNKKFILILLFLLVTIVPLFSQVKGWTFNLLLKTILSSDIPYKSVEEVEDNLDHYTILDAREPEEYTVSQIRTARPVGYKDFQISDIKDISFAQPILVYCAVGKRSETIVKNLKAAGYDKVYNLYGGIFEWVNRGNTVYTPEGIPTNKVHAYNRFFAGFLDKGEKVY